MTIFNRISRILTPPPTRRDSATQEEGPFEPPRDQCAAELKALLPSLIAESDHSALESREALAELTRIAHAYGAYKTASTLHRLVDTQKRDDDDDFSHDRKRGYALAGDLYLIHLKACIAAIESKPMGPRVFQEYFVDILDCYHAADRNSKAIEAAIRVTEKLWVMSIEPTEHSDTYLAFADRCIATAIETSTQKFEQHRLAMHKLKRQMRSGHTPPPMRVPSAAGMDPSLLKHLFAVKDALQRGRACNPELLGVYAAIPAQPQQSLPRLWECARQINYAGFAGPMLDRMATVFPKPISGDGRKMCLIVAKACETLAATEAKIDLGGVARSHLASAMRLYCVGGDESSAARLERIVSAPHAE